MSRAHKIIVALLIAWGVFFVLAIILTRLLPARQKTEWGVSFDPVYSDYLGLNTGETFVTILDDWQFRYIRIPLHWNAIEPQQGKFDFARYDVLLKEAAKRNAKIILALGQKTPRWPECHLPDWANSLLPEKQNGAMTAYVAALNEYIAQIVTHFKDNPSLEMWQVENEPFFSFGNCPNFSLSELASEISLVKSLDPNHKVLVTDSGELSSWRQTVNVADYFGTTMYRIVWDKRLGYVSYNWLPAFFYRTKLWWFDRLPTTAFVVELQAEPWIPNEDIMHTSIDEQNKSIDLDQLHKNIEYAKDVGFARTYLWGAEWWVWLQKQGHNEIPEYIKQLPK